MKKLYNTLLRNHKTFFTALLPVSLAFIAIRSDAQTYYSIFPSVDAANYKVTSPSGGNCAAPEVTDASNIADNSLGSYAYFQGLITDSLKCSKKNYVFNAAIDLPSDSITIQPGNYAGFRIRIPGGISGTELLKYLTVSTYKNNIIKETKSAEELTELDASPNGSLWFVYFQTSKFAFNRVELTVNSNIMTLGSNFEFDVYYAFGAHTIAFPVTVEGFKAVAANNNITVSWQSVNEINVANYTVEKSSNGGVSYAPVATLGATGNGTYSYTDKAAANGNYLYRLKVTDKDGSFVYTGSALISLAGISKLWLYPSVVKAGQTVHVNNAATGMIHLAVYDTHGRTVSQQSKVPAGTLNIATDNLPAGMYVVKMINASGSVAQSKFVVE